jgi:ketopantoate hydroxymethyltransferase
MGRAGASYRELWRLLEAGVLLALVEVRQMPVEVVQKIHLHTSIGLISIGANHHPGSAGVLMVIDRTIVYQYFVE